MSRRHRASSPGGLRPVGSGRSSSRPRPPTAAVPAPQDGRATPRQLDQYVAVRDRIRIALATGSSSFPAGRKNELDAAALESRGAAEAGVPLEEYLWVREKILEADAAAASSKQNADLIAMLEKTVGS